MKKGFSHGEAPRLIREKPGMTSTEVAKLALGRGLCSSDSKKYPPEVSLGNTLAKEVREGRLPGIVARKEGGVLRYYPTDGTIPTSPSINPEEPVSLRLPRASLEKVDELVEVGQVNSRSEALAWLVGEGIKANEGQLDKVHGAVQQIREIKRSFSGP